MQVPPKLLTQYPLDRIDVNQTMNASIKCEFYGKPEPLIKWYKYQRGSQKEMEKYRGQSTINLFIHKDSASVYECVADNSIPPTISKKIYLNIQRNLFILISFNLDSFDYQRILFTFDLKISFIVNEYHKSSLNIPWATKSSSIRKFPGINS